MDLTRNNIQEYSHVGFCLWGYNERSVEGLTFLKNGYIDTEDDEWELQKLSSKTIQLKKVLVYFHHGSVLCIHKFTNILCNIERNVPNLIQPKHRKQTHHKAITENIISVMNPLHCECFPPPSIFFLIIEYPPSSTAVKTKLNNRSRSHPLICHLRIIFRCLVNWDWQFSFHQHRVCIFRTI